MNRLIQFFIMICNYDANTLLGVVLGEILKLNT